MRYSIGARDFDFSAHTFVMGVLNVTPDSFSDGGKYCAPEQAIARGLEMVREGAHIIDVGGESTRPRGATYGEGGASVAVEQEINRVVPVIKGLHAATDVPISIDTWKAEVADAALRAGASIVNDISGFLFDKSIAVVAARHGATAILMHTPAPPWQMPEVVEYGDLLEDVRRYLEEACGRARQAGVRQMIVDPGIGFGKTLEQNLTLIKRVDAFHGLGCPILVGASRKSFIGRITGLPVEERLEGSLAAAVAAVFAGASIVRVHDVLPTVRAVAVADAIVRGNVLRSPSLNPAS